jgi:hypothetical protein
VSEDIFGALKLRKKQDLALAIFDRLEPESAEKTKSKKNVIQH